MPTGPGTLLDGRYRLLRVLGRGGMGCVYEAEHARIGRKVAVKVLHASMSQDPDALRRFEREAQAAAKIGSPHIADVYDIGETPDGEPYMVLELLEGESLQQRFRRHRRLTAAELFPFAIGALRGLADAHAVGIVHRDLKPANLFLVKEREGVRDFLKVLDFGVSKFRQLDRDGGGITSTGVIVGTPHYMAPEQTKGTKYIDHRSDLYALGVVLYRGLAGRVPYRADTMPELIRKLIMEEPTPLTELVDGVHPAAAELVSHALEREPEDRFQSAERFAEALQQFLDELQQDGDSTMRERLPSARASRPVSAAADVSATAVDAAAAEAAAVRTAERGTQVMEAVGDSTAGAVRGMAPIPAPLPRFASGDGGSLATPWPSAQPVARGLTGGAAGARGLKVAAVACLAAAGAGVMLWLSSATPDAMNAPSGAGFPTASAFLPPDHTVAVTPSAAENGPGEAAAPPSSGVPTVDVAASSAATSSAAASASGRGAAPRPRDRPPVAKSPPVAKAPPARRTDHIRDDL